MMNNTIIVSTSEGVQFLLPGSIIRCVASSNYTWFYFQDKLPLLVSTTMGAYELCLMENNFVRIHRATIINRQYIDKVSASGAVWLKDGTRLQISRRRRSYVSQLLRSA